MKLATWNVNSLNAPLPRVLELLELHQPDICPDDRDIYDPAAFVGETQVTPEERERFHALLHAGVVDAFREVHPDDIGFTWWDYRQGHFHRKMGLRPPSCSSRPTSRSAWARSGSTATSARGRSPRTTPRCSSS